ncbi:hypothetical protein CTI12_AA617210 [Artemisia annua]|uniref:Uncharacterized protein n=1 Tax=Artemisia annua TaxID=35608 RepID=A0A2U1KCX7_ARTAN|nr:hypothetical protein CTI12_AA617210 [Artemisia annua]
MMKEDSCQVELGVKVQRLIKKLQKYDRDEHKEADAIDQASAKRKASCLLRRL